MNKLYLVFNDDIEGLFLRGCFSTKELAEAFRKELPGRACEYEIFETAIDEEFKPHG